MAKGLRSKVKRHFRTLKRGAVTRNPEQVAADAAKQAGLAAAAAAPPPPRDPRLVAIDAANAAPMAVDLPELTTQNPAKLVKKLRERRRAAARGALGLPPALKAKKGKKAKPLAGSNQFHKGSNGKKKKRR